jgi:hypothetical protein
MYWPYKYFKGLSTRKAIQRKKDVRSRLDTSWKTRRAYRPFKTDIGVKTRTSKYVSRLRKLVPTTARSLPAYSKATGVPLPILKQSYTRGMAAWRTGHRPGATQQQWGYARVASLLTCGKTYYTTDSDLVRKAISTSTSARRWFHKTCKN